MEPLIIDVREPDEYRTGHHNTAINIPLEQLGSDVQLAALSKDTPITVYCRSGARSQVAHDILTQRGFTNVTNGINQENLNK